MKQAILAEGGKDHSGDHKAPNSTAIIFSLFYSANSNSSIQFSAFPSEFELPRFFYIYGIYRSWETIRSVKMADTSYDIIGR